MSDRKIERRKKKGGLEFFFKNSETVALERGENDEFWFFFCLVWLRNGHAMGVGSLVGVVADFSCCERFLWLLLVVVGGNCMKMLPGDCAHCPLRKISYFMHIKKAGVRAEKRVRCAAKNRV